MGTAVVESRLELRTLATLDRYLEQSGNAARSKSDLLWRVTELLCQTLVQQGFVTYMDDEEEAFVHLSSKYGALGKGGRNGRRQAADMQMAVLAKDGFDPAYASKVKTKGEDESDIKVRYRTACMLAKQYGQPTVTFEEFCDNLEKMRAQIESDKQSIAEMHDAFAHPELLKKADG